MRTVRLVALAALVVLVAAARFRGPRFPGYEVLPDMARSVPYDAYAPSPVTRDGRTLRAPVPGTIPAGGPLPFRYAATAADAERAGRELRNPLAPTPAVLARGEAVYRAFCAVCHGERGAGDGPVVPPFPNPPSYHSTRLLSMADGQVFHVITRGSGMMPAYAGQIPPADRWAVVHHVRRLQKRPPLELAQVHPR